LVGADFKRDRRTDALRDKLQDPPVLWCVWLIHEELKASRAREASYALR
jgi:hypothetical protein